ncbi:putative TetR family transcriptional regulator [Microlunatus phosphovorus NM-1]|uniref:Putative TetR family transcriptional regulator n=1 Tax=Microlunatus phosphovorus (strain ATCC 700054 / DSM 10555 / JCM 9379 / NBRC 101784 / NCIMB 13414 / VKM Ac-1990 / NM-1) TaxID=1032480 RepID=F5XMU9_MICPN|nr:TetR/AcrR family transcriptional regulator [Microlunatus phosphovorus]BAK34022.1 putative TetR family transcriptional regulator [Microlunatus phosphovorus NM-1]
MPNPGRTANSGRSSGETRPSTSRREQILAVAATQFAERGFHGVSVYDLGAALGISGAALYKHFASKEALLGEMLVGISERLLSEGQRRADEAAAAGPDAVLQALIGWHVEFALAHPALITVQLRDVASLAEPDRHSVRDLQRRYVELWVRAIRAAVGGDETRARSAAHATFGLINSTPHSARLRRAEMADLLQQMALGALRTTNSRSL